jgi:hypothetical protein
MQFVSSLESAGSLHQVGIALELLPGSPQALDWMKNDAVHTKAAFFIQQAQVSGC